ncbi:MAG: hypothetical protein Q9219_003519 [cf. Caloplaca sp. 3 TL-2023]
MGYDLAKSWYRLDDGIITSPQYSNYSLPTSPPNTDQFKWIQVDEDTAHNLNRNLQGHPFLEPPPQSHAGEASASRAGWLLPSTSTTWSTQSMGPSTTMTTPMISRSISPASQFDLNTSRIGSTFETNLGSSRQQILGYHDYEENKKIQGKLRSCMSCYNKSDRKTFRHVNIASESQSIAVGLLKRRSSSTMVGNPPTTAEWPLVDIHENRSIKLLPLSPTPAHNYQVCLQKRTMAAFSIDKLLDGYFGSESCLSSLKRNEWGQYLDHLLISNHRLCSLLYLMSHPEGIVVTYCDHEIEILPSFVCTIFQEFQYKAVDLWGKIFQELRSWTTVPRNKRSFQKQKADVATSLAQVCRSIGLYADASSVWLMRGVPLCLLTSRAELSCYMAWIGKGVDLRSFEEEMRKAPTAMPADYEIPSKVSKPTFQPRLGLHDPSLSPLGNTDNPGAAATAVDPQVFMNSPANPPHEIVCQWQEEEALACAIAQREETNIQLQNMGSELEGKRQMLNILESKYEDKRQELLVLDGHICLRQRALERNMWKETLPMTSAVEDNLGSHSSGPPMAVEHHTLPWAATSESSRAYWSDQLAASTQESYNDGEKDN